MCVNINDFSCFVLLMTSRCHSDFRSDILFAYPLFWWCHRYHTHLYSISTPDKKIKTMYPFMTYILKKINWEYTFIPTWHWQEPKLLKVRWLYYPLNIFGRVNESAHLNFKINQLWEPLDFPATLRLALEELYPYYILIPWTYWFQKWRHTTPTQMCLWNY